MLLVTTDWNGRWGVFGGTSIAAPYVTASLAALKSMFPNLSYQDVRARILATADRTGRYADAANYGRGRLDLDAASRPEGGTRFALGALDTGAVASTAGAYRMSREAAGVALGFAGETGRWRAVMVSGEAGFGTAGWSPETVLAASFAPHGGRDAFGVSLAPDLGRPMGWEGSGALALEGGGTALGWRRNVADRDAVRLDVTGRLAHLATRAFSGAAD